MRFEKILTILKREYVIVTRKKLFWIVSIGGPLAYLLLIFGVGFMVGTGLQKGQKIRIYDGVGLGPGVRDTMERAKMVVEVLPRPAGETPIADLEARKVDVIIDVPPEVRNEPAAPAASASPPESGDGASEPAGPHVTIYTRRGGNLIVKETAEKSLNEQLRALWLSGRGLDPAAVNAVFGKRVDIRGQEVGAGGKKSSSNQLMAMMVCLFSMMLVMMPSLIWGMELMRSIIEEKNQRIMEILISSLSPFELLAGKVLGIGLVGLTQLGIWLALVGGLTAGGIAAMPPEAAHELSRVLGTLHWWHLPALLLFFVLSFMIYALLFAAVGSAVNSEKDAQQFVTPIMLVMMLPMMMLSVIIMAPDAPHVVIMSLIPIYSPMLLMLRMALGTLPLWQGVLGVGLTVATLFGLLWASSKIFRVGILMYGQKPSLAELVKWIGRS